MSEKKSLPLWQESILLVTIAVVVAFVVKTFFAQAFYIPSSSMEPTMRVDDRVLVQKVSYWWGEPGRGDIVVFEDPGGWLDANQVQTADGFFQNTLARIGLFPAGGHLIKRVVGVGGDTIVCCDDQNRILVNDEPLDETYVLDPDATANSGEFEVTVPEGHLWVMGDNRANSADSRAHRNVVGEGTISVDLVVGKAWLRVWPLGRMGFFRGEETYDALAEP